MVYQVSVQFSSATPTAQVRPLKSNISACSSSNVWKYSAGRVCHALIDLQEGQQSTEVTLLVLALCSEFVRAPLEL